MTTMRWWRDVPDFEGVYEVNRWGQVRRVSTGHIKAHRNCQGYRTLSLWKNNRQFDVLVHRVVAGAFIPNPDGKRTVNHKDGDKTNNRRTNLEWATYTENMEHSYRIKLREHKHKKPVKLSDGRVFDSITAAAQSLGVQKCTVQGALKRGLRVRGFGVSHT